MLGLGRTKMLIITAYYIVVRETWM